MIFSERAGDRILSGTQFMTMVRTPEWKLVYFVEGNGQLFDMQNDPDEIVDLWDDPNRAETRQALLMEILPQRSYSVLSVLKKLPSLLRATLKQPCLLQWKVLGVWWKTKIWLKQ